MAWGEAATGPGDFVVYSAYRLDAGLVAVVGLGYGMVENHWQQTLWPSCHFADAAGAFVRGPRPRVVPDAEARIANPEVALFKAAVIVCPVPGLAAGAADPDRPLSLRIALGSASLDVEAVVPRRPRTRLAMCSRVFGARPRRISSVARACTHPGAGC